jgi:hypothetical protein
MFYFYPWIIAFERWAEVFRRFGLMAIHAESRQGAKTLRLSQQFVVMF